jgi:hypothetical protein
MPLMISLKDSYEIKDQAQKFGSNKKHLVCNPGKSRLKVTTNVGQRVERLSAFKRPQAVVLKRCLRFTGNDLFLFDLNKFKGDCLVCNRS